VHPRRAVTCCGSSAVGRQLLSSDEC
jgi:hypothetical protein